MNYFRSNFLFPPWSYIYRFIIQSISIPCTCILHTRKEIFLIYQSPQLQHIQFYFSSFYNIFFKQRYVSKHSLSILSICIISGQTLFFVTMVMQIQNLIYFNSIQLFQYLTYFRFKVKLSHSTMVLGLTIQNSIHLNMIEIKSVYFKSIQFNLNIFAFQLYFILFYMFQDFVNI